MRVWGFGDTVPTIDTSLSPVTAVLCSQGDRNFLFYRFSVCIMVSSCDGWAAAVSHSPKSTHWLSTMLQKVYSRQTAYRTGPFSSAQSSSISKKSSFGTADWEYQDLNPTYPSSLVGWRFQAERSSQEDQGFQTLHSAYSKCRGVTQRKVGSYCHWQCSGVGFLPRGKGRA